MIVTSDAATGRREFVFSPFQFQLGPPGESPFEAMPPTALTQQKDLSFDFSWVETPYESGVTRAEAILEDILTRSQLDVERFPSSAYVRANYGLALLNAGRLDRAAEEFEESLKFSPRHFMSLANLARVRTLQGRFEEAENLCTKLSNDRPNESAPLVNLAYIALRMEAPDRAIAILKRAIAIDKTAVLPRYLMAVALLSATKPREAIGHLRIAARSDVRSPTVYQALGVAYIMARDAKRAVRSFKTALTLSPEMKEPVHALANVLLQQGHNESLIELLTCYLETKPSDTAARELLSEAYSRLEKYSAARLQLTAALRNIRGDGENEAKDRARLLNNIGVCFDFQGDSIQAAQWVERSIAAHPAYDAMPYHNLAKLQFREGRFNQAWKILESCRENFPANHDTPELQVAVLAKQERYDEAIALLSTEIGTGAASVVTYAFLGHFLGEIKSDFAGAHEILLQGLTRYPNAPALVNSLAYLYLMNERPGKARRLLESLPGDIEPGRLQLDVTLTATWGLLYLWEGEIEKGKEYYGKAEKLAHHRRNRVLETAVKQKMHLELAKTFLRQHEIRLARIEILSGLSLRNGQDIYEKQLISLKDTLGNTTDD